MVEEKQIVQSVIDFTSPHFVAGVDPYDHIRANGSTEAEGVMYIFDRNLGVPVLEFCCGSPDPEYFYMKCFEFCSSYGCKVLIENNRVGMIHYGINYGHKRIMATKLTSSTDKSSYTGLASREFGICMSETIWSKIEKLLKGYFPANTGVLLKFPDLFRDLAAFVAMGEKTSRIYSFGITLYQAEYGNY